MKLQGILSAMSLVAIAGAAVPVCPEGCEEACCADGETEKVHVVELTSDMDLPKLVELHRDDAPNVHVKSMIRGDDDDQVSVTIKIINDDVSAFVNSKEIDERHIIHKDGQIVIKIDGQDDIVIPTNTGGWATFKDAAPGFTWRDGGKGNFVFAPKGDKDFTIFQPSGGSNRAFIGINISDADENLLANLGIDGGISIKSVIDGTPAAIAGIRADDLLVKINGKHAFNVDQLREILGDKKPGDQVKVQVIREGDNKTFEIRLAPSTGFGEFSFDEQVIELSPEFNVDINVEEILKGLNSKTGNLQFRTELHADFTDELKEKLQGLHLELEPLHEMQNKLHGQLKEQLHGHLQGKVQGELMEQLQGQIMEQLQGQLHGKFENKVFGELRHKPAQGGVMVAPRLRLHSGENGVFEFKDGESGGVFTFDADGFRSGEKGVFRLKDGKSGGVFLFDAQSDHDAGHSPDLDARLDRLAHRIERIEERLDRLANALEKQ